MKRMLICITSVILLTFTLFLVGCGDNTVNSVSMYDLSRKMTNAADSSVDMTYISSEDSDAENLFSYISDIDYDKINSFFVSYATDGSVSADEIGVILVKDQGDVKDTLESIREHVNNRRTLYSNYKPDEVDKIDSAICFSEGNYVVLIISDGGMLVESAFRDMIS